MIRTEELRLGNWIMDMIVYEPVQVKTIGPWVEEWLVEPIPLTEEWLKKVNMAYGDIFWSNFSEDKDGYFLWIGGFKLYFKYIHTLQNAFYALTNSELTIKE